MCSPHAFVTCIYRMCIPHVHNTGVYHMCILHVHTLSQILNTCAQHSCLTLMLDTRARHSTLVLNTRARHSCSTLVLDTRVRHSCPLLVLGTHANNYSNTNYSALDCYIRTFDFPIFRAVCFIHIISLHYFITFLKKKKTSYLLRFFSQSVVIWECSLGTFLSLPFVHEAAVGAAAAAPSYAYNNPTTSTTSATTGGSRCRCYLASTKLGSSHPDLYCDAWPRWGMTD